MTNKALDRTRFSFGLGKTKQTMKKPNFPLLPSAILLFFLVAACGKSNSSGSGQNNTDANTTLLTQQAWVYDTAGIGIDNSGTIVLGLPPNLLSPCQTDDTLYFKANGTGTENQGPIACNPPTAQSISFQWSFNAQENMITSSDSLFTGFGGSITITSLTATQLHLLKTVQESGSSYIVDLYLKHP
jgi:hypothetical protein